MRVSARSEGECKAHCRSQLPWRVTSKLERMNFHRCFISHIPEQPQFITAGDLLRGANLQFSQTLFQNTVKTRLYLGQRGPREPPPKKKLKVTSKKIVKNGISFSSGFIYLLLKST